MKIIFISFWWNVEHWFTSTPPSDPSKTTHELSYFYERWYKEGHQRDYINQGRSKHYKKLEQWLNEMLEKPASDPNYLKKQNVASNLTEDSCFWAHVEDALISCKLLNSSELSTDHRDKESSKLVDFENCVYSSMKNYAVSPEIGRASCRERV